MANNTQTNAGVVGTDAEAGGEGRVGLGTQEVRLATTMTGGVSLAIWMGGVARELNLLAQASCQRHRMTSTDPLPPIEVTDDPTLKLRKLYLGLIDLLDVTVEMDVLSGSSAGGINAALLAYSRVQGKDLGAFRSLWLDIGALLTLLRNPGDPDIPSLLLGDGQMLAQLAKHLPELDDAPPDAMPIGDTPTDLFVTTTLLTGEIGRFTDSYGTQVQDVDYHGVFRFDSEHLSKAEVTGALALAARSSASFPGAFEPSYIPYDKDMPAVGTTPVRPSMAQYGNITRSHWAADGGALDNEPVGLLLQTVFDRPAERLVRRVLLYVVPTAGTAPDPMETQPGDDPTPPYGLVEALLHNVTAIRNQSIANDLRAIRDHNDRIGVRTDTRLQLATLATRLPPSADASDPPTNLLTDELLDDYRAREAGAFAHAIVAALMRQITTWPLTTRGMASEKPSIPTTWQAALQPGNTAELDCRNAAVARLAARWTSVPITSAELAMFDRPGYDGAKAVALSILRTAYPLAKPAERRVLAQCVRDLHQALQPPSRPTPASVVDKCCSEEAIRAMDLPEAAAEMAARYLASLVDDNAAATSAPDATTTLAGAWFQMGEVFTQTGQDLLSELAGRSGPGTAALRTYVDYLRLDQAETVASRLFALFAVQRAMLPISADVEQPVELVQVSADTRTTLDPRRNTAASKLTGMQLHHFGAFFKQSWRANDWMWGRLDGAGWLVHLLLDPRRIKVVAEERTDREQQPNDLVWFLEKLVAMGVALPAVANAKEQPVTIASRSDLSLPKSIHDELSFLEAGGNPPVDPPVSMPNTALWVARTWQLHIAADELPTVAAAIREPQNEGSSYKAGYEYVSPREKTWADSVVKARADNKLVEQVATLLPSCPVPDQTLKDEVGTPLMVRTIAKAAAAGAGAVHSIQQVPTVLRPATTWFRTIALAGYRVTTAVKPWPKNLIGIGFLLLLVGGVLAVQQSAAWGLSGLAVMAVGAYLIVFGAWQTSPLVLVSLFSATVLIAAISLTLPHDRTWLFGTSEKDGWVGERVPWIGSAWWHPLVVLTGVLLSGATVLLVAGAIRRLSIRLVNHTLRRRTEKELNEQQGTRS